MNRVVFVVDAISDSQHFAPSATSTRINHSTRKSDAQLAQMSVCLESETVLLMQTFRCDMRQTSVPAKAFCDSRSHAGLDVTVYAVLTVTEL